MRLLYILRRAVRVQRGRELLLFVAAAGMDGVSAGTICFHPKLTTGARRESKLIDGQRSMAVSTGAATDGRNGGAFFFSELDSTKISPVRWLL
jgi:hypothetical protein